MGLLGRGMRTSRADLLGSARRSGRRGSRGVRDGGSMCDGLRARDPRVVWFPACWGAGRGTESCVAFCDPRLIWFPACRGVGRGTPSCFAFRDPRSLPVPARWVSGRLSGLRRVLFLDPALRPAPVRLPSPRTAARPRPTPPFHRCLEPEGRGRARRQTTEGPGKCLRHSLRESLSAFPHRDRRASRHDPRRPLRSVRRA
jgi:hypothetical protein